MSGGSRNTTPSEEIREARSPACACSTAPTPGATQGLQHAYFCFHNRNNIVYGVSFGSSRQSNTDEIGDVEWLSVPIILADCGRFWFYLFCWLFKSNTATSLCN